MHGTYSDRLILFQIMLILSCFLRMSSIFVRIYAIVSTALTTRPAFVSAKARLISPKG